MNIFPLDEDPYFAAIYHHDIHVNKMILESAQMLSTAHRVLDGTEVIGKSKSGRNQKQYILDNSKLDQTLYKASFINHPCSVWSRQTTGNYYWLRNLFIHLLLEFGYRRRHTNANPHKSIYLSNSLQFPPINCPRGERTQFVQAMPEQYQIEDNPVQAYRNYYIGEKGSFVRNGKVVKNKWTNRETPNWFKSDVCGIEAEV